jgi:hypothetical protein
MRFKDAPKSEGQKSEDMSAAENGALAASIVDYKFIH